MTGGDDGKKAGAGVCQPSQVGGEMVDRARFEVVKYGPGKDQVELLEFDRKQGVEICLWCNLKLYGILGFVGETAEQVNNVQPARIAGEEVNIPGHGRPEVENIAGAILVEMGEGRLQPWRTVGLGRRLDRGPFVFPGLFDLTIGERPAPGHYGFLPSAFAALEESLA